MNPNFEVQARIGKKKFPVYRQGFFPPSSLADPSTELESLLDGLLLNCTSTEELEELMKT